MKKMASSIIEDRFKTIPNWKQTLLTKLKEFNLFDFLFLGIAILPIWAIVMMIKILLGG